jgi:hypothetical protein
MAWSEVRDFGTVILQPASFDWHGENRMLRPVAWALSVMLLVGLPLVLVTYLFAAKRGPALASALRALPRPTEPTARAVGPEDLMGRWQFYIDRASQTVSLDFRPDGTFAQTITANQGGIRECPGGTWRLDGACVNLTGYVTACDGESQPSAWWMIDTPTGLALYGGDGAGAESCYCFRRARPLVWREVPRPLDE